eukprot:UN22168
MLKLRNLLKEQHYNFDRTELVSFPICNLRKPSDNVDVKPPPLNVNSRPFMKLAPLKIDPIAEKFSTHVPPETS